MTSYIILIIVLMLDVFTFLTESRVIPGREREIIPIFNIIKSAEMILLIVAICFAKEFLSFFICSIYWVSLFHSLGKIRGLSDGRNEE